LLAETCATPLEEAGLTVGVFSRTTGCDLMDLHMTWERLDAFRPDYVVNCAALVGSINYVNPSFAPPMSSTSTMSEIILTLTKPLSSSVRW